MLDTILREMESLTLSEKRRLAAAAQAAVARELAGVPEAPASCPRCGSARFVRKGRGRDGSQRWLCRGCGRTFSAGTMSLLGQSRLPAWKWSRFVGMAVSGASLRACAAACGVCLRTSWYMRVRLCEVMRRALQPFRTGPTVSWQVDGTYYDESLKGMRGMPREARRRGGASRSRGISSSKVCVECGANDLGDCFCRLCDRGRPSDAALAASLEGVGGGSWVSTDAHAGYARVLPAIGAAEHVAVATRDQRGGELGMVNALHQRLRIFLWGFHGVSTRWLDHYLWWFAWLEQARRAGADGEATLSGQAARGRYELTRAETVSRPRPFWGYWEDRMSMVV